MVAYDHHGMGAGGGDDLVVRPGSVSTAPSGDHHSGLTSSVVIFNDFVNPSYFLPGTDFPTVQLTLYNFQSRFNTQWNLLFMNVLLITVPPFIAFVLFNRKIVAGMTAGAIKG